MKQQFAVGAEIKVGAGFLIENEIAYIYGSAEGMLSQQSVLLGKKNKPAESKAGEQHHDKRRKNTSYTSYVEIQYID